MTLTPSSQRNDPLAWAGNQCGHMAIGFGLSLVVGPVVAALAYFIAWEVLYQMRRLGGGWRDSVADSLFVTVGALLAAYPAFQVHIFAGFAVMLVIQLVIVLLAVKFISVVEQVLALVHL